MKTTNTIRILAGLSFLIFFCPFFQMCSDENLQSAIVKIDDSMNWESLSTEQKTEYKRGKFTSNGYELSAYVFEKKIEPEDFKESILYAYIFSTLVLIFSAAIFILAIIKKSRGILLLAIITLFIEAATVVLLALNGILEDISQIKFGYYLFILNTIALAVLSYKVKKETVN